MMSENILHELDRRSVNVSNVSPYSLEWSENSLYLMVGKEFTIYEFTYNISQKQKSLDFRNTTIACPVGHPAAKRYIMKLFKHNRVSNREYNEMLTEPVYWPFFSIFSPDMSAFISIKWSPSSFIHRNQNILAGLTNMGILHVYVRTKFTWLLLCNFYMSIEEFYNITDLEIRKKQDMKELGLKIGTSAFCWGPKCSEESCTIITAQRNGDVIFWEFCCLEDKVDIQPIVRLSLDQVEKTSLQCIEISNTVHLLLYTTNNGQLYAHVIKIQGHNINILKSITPWPHSDKIAINSIRHVLINNYLIIAYTKHRHLILQMIDECYEIKDQYTNNINDYTITSLILDNEQLLICTENCELFKINVTIDNNKLNIDLIQFKFKEASPSHLLRGFSISKNNALWTLMLTDRSCIAGKLEKANALVFLCPHESHEFELIKLIEHPDKCLKGLWDIIEVIRLKTMKLKALPNYDYEAFYKDSETDLYKLKVYLLVAILHKSLKDLALTFKAIPEDDVSKLKETILAKYCYNVILSNANQDLNTIEESDIATVVNCRTFLECYCRKYNLNVLDYIDDSIKRIQNKSTYICQSCDNTIVELSCKDNHVNPICSRTLTPLEDNEYLSCPSCNSISKIDKRQKLILCVFCDLVMVNNN